VLLAATSLLPSLRLRFVVAQNATASPVVGTSAPASSPAPSSEGGWGGCVNLKGNNPSLSIGERTIVCLQIGNSVNWAGGVSYIRLSFTPETDQYSRFYVPNCTFSEMPPPVFHRDLC
jgi:hypothetical protein